jgi:hypothetical protein
MRLPEPADLTSLVLRTDLSGDRGWETAWVAIIESDEYPSATFVSDPAFVRVDVVELAEADAAADDDARVLYLFLADAVTMSHPEHLLRMPPIARAHTGDSTETGRSPLAWCAGGEEAADLGT